LKITSEYLLVFRKIYSRLKDSQIDWALTGSLGFALHGIDVEVHDIDIQTDERGAYAIGQILAEYERVNVRLVCSERVRSHLGVFEIDGIKVEIMGALQKMGDDQAWEAPVDVNAHKCFIEVEEMHVPVLSVEYEYQAYLKMGRIEKAEILRKWLEDGRK
jgi:hypothetical protein